MCQCAAGHVHAYERSVRVYNNRPHECGPVHIVIGDGGNREVCCFATCRKAAWSNIDFVFVSHKLLEALCWSHLAITTRPTTCDVALPCTGLVTRLPGSAKVVCDAGGQLRSRDPGL